tara:strand:+ start:1618 stop:2067 length:450 start_codon:yes stop_codon:yes gene_type:complete
MTQLFYRYRISHHNADTKLITFKGELSQNSHLGYADTVAEALTQLSGIVSRVEAENELPVTWHSSTIDEVTTADPAEQCSIINALERASYLLLCDKDETLEPKTLLNALSNIQEIIHWRMKDIRARGFAVAKENDRMQLSDRGLRGKLD